MNFPWFLSDKESSEYQYLLRFTTVTADIYAAYRFVHLDSLKIEIFHRAIFAGIKDTLNFRDLGLAESRRGVCMIGQSISV